MLPAAKKNGAATAIMTMPTITSVRNPRIVEARKLDQRKHRQQQERFAVEGLQLLHMALESGARPLDVFYCEALFTGAEAPMLLKRFREVGADLVPVTQEVMTALSDREAPQGIFATFALQPLRLDQLVLTGDDLVVVLDRLQDPGNVGTILRTADAADAAAVVLLIPCVDPFDPKTVRASMGSLFNVQIVQTADPAALFEALRAAGLTPMGADAKRGRAWTEVDWRGGMALVLGNEARGLSEDVAPLITTWASLPIRGKAESLNVAVAAGVLMYAWVQANAPS